jgi:uncharacterized membrane protein
MDCAAWVGGAALAFSSVVFWYAASPWWGSLAEPLHSPLDVALLFGLYAAGASASLWLARRGSLTPPEFARFATTAGVIDVFVLVTLMIRYAFEGVHMRVGLREASLETWTFSAVWGLFGLAVLLIGGARRDLTLRWLGLAVLLGTVAKVFLFDMARLEGAARAASFLALGVLLLAGALAARRLNAGAGLLGMRPTAASAAEPDETGS